MILNTGGLRRLAHEPARNRLQLQIVLERAVVAAGKQEQALGLVRGGEQLLAHRVGHLLVAAGVEQEQAGVRSQASRRRRRCRASAARTPWPSRRSESSPDRPRERAHEEVLGGRADRHHGAELRVAGRGVNGGEAAHARSAQRHPRRVRPEDARHRERVVEGARAELALGAAVTARVVGQRGHALVPASAREVEVALLRRTGAVEHHDARPGLTLGQEERVGKAVARAQLGGAGGVCLMRSEFRTDTHT